MEKSLKIEEFKQLVLLRAKTTPNQRDVVFVTPRNHDSTIFGTISVIQNNLFHFDEVNFQDDDVFVDMGCNIGLVSAAVAQINPRIKCIAIDACPAACYLAKINFAINSVDGIVLNYAVGSQEGTAKFRHNNKDTSCLSRDDFQEYENPSDIMEIKQASFKKIIQDCGKVKYLKMDIEGAEYEIFEDLLDNEDGKDILSNIEYLHLEAHEVKDHNPQILRNKLKEIFGEKIYFDA